MKRKYLYTALFLSLTALAQAQTDTTLNRNVTVEREFQPTVQAAGKINAKPAVTETELPAHTVEYSDYNALLSPAFNTNDLLSQPTRFTSPQPLHGYVRGGFGHTNTLFDFGYSLSGQTNGKRVRDVLDVYAHHRAQWGVRADSKTRLGLRFAHSFSACQLYFGLEGRNGFFTHYGRYFDPIGETLTVRKASEINPADKQTTWGVDAFVGVKSAAKSDFQYQIQAGYTLYALPQYAVENQVRTMLNLSYKTGRHRAGANLSAVDAFISTHANEQADGSYAELIEDSLYNPRHAIRIEPYYAYAGKRFNIHVGVNLDLNIGRGQQFSANENISFAPSPNVKFEGQIAKEWLTVYGDITGSFGTGILQSYMEAMPYRSRKSGITSHHVASYTPVDATVGFHIKPWRDLLINIYGGYAYLVNQRTLIATAESFTGNTADHERGKFVYAYSDYGRGKIGAAFHYHYQDIIRIRLDGNYYFWSVFRYENIPLDYQQFFADSDGQVPQGKIYDRAAWDLSLRIDGRIDEHWSLYSENFFEGKRLALTTRGEHTLKPTVQLNLGCQYEQKQWAVFLQLNNYIHRHNDIYYGYRSEGINFLLGGSYKF